MASKKGLPVTNPVTTAEKGASLRGCAKEIGVSHVRLLTLAKEGKVPRNPDGSFDVEAVRAAFAKSREPSQRSKIIPVQPGEQAAPAVPPATVDGEKGWFDTRNEHEKLKLRLTQIELDLKEGRIVDANRVMMTVGGMIIAAKTSFLSMANDLADELATESDPVIVRSTLSDKIHHILGELSKWKLKPEGDQPAVS